MCWSFIAIAYAAFAQPAIATSPSDINDEAQLDAFLPRQQSLDDILKKIQAAPDNLDNYFTYAKAAESTKQYKEAIWAYQEMLSRDKTLDRVRLDLSLAYIANKQFVEARKLLEEVLSHNPPKPVQDNIHTILAKMGTAGKRHVFAGSVSTGFNHDSNAAAAPSSGNVSVLDTSIPLSQTQRKHADTHNFQSVTVSHTYQPDPIIQDIGMVWKSSGTNYNTLQNHFKDLDINLFSARTGPEIIYEPLGIHLGIAAVYNYITLNHNDYLHNPRLEFTTQLPLTSQLSLLLGHALEYRNFHNSHTVTTYTDSSGPASQEQVGLHYTFSERSSLDFLSQFRDEDASMEYQANHQSGFLATYTRMFDDGYFVAPGYGIKHTHYAVPYPLISSDMRTDNQTTYQIIAGKKLDFYDLVLSGGYTFTNVQSTIQNFTYYDHRLNLTLTKNF